MPIFGSGEESGRIDRVEERQDRDRELSVATEKLLVAHVAKCEEQTDNIIDNQKRIEDRLNEQITISKVQHAENQIQIHALETRLRSMQWWLLGGMITLTVTFPGIHDMLAPIFHLLSHIE